MPDITEIHTISSEETDAVAEETKTTEIFESEGAGAEIMPDVYAYPESMRSCYIGVFGAPNAGKSSLVNRIVGAKVAIVSPKEQTTRRRVRGVYTEGDVQLVFVDTPGLFSPNPKHHLEKFIVNEATEELTDPDGPDIRLLVVDANRGLCERAKNAISLMRGRASVVLNKTDLVTPKTELLKLTAKLLHSYAFEDVFMTCARTGHGVKEMVKTLQEKAKPAPWMFPGSDVSDAGVFFSLAETTRECLYYALQQELPYGVAVVTDSVTENKRGQALVRQTIYLAKEGHKPMVIGAGGSALKELGENSRRRMRAVLGKKTHLFLHVKVKEDWTRRPETLAFA